MFGERASHVILNLYSKDTKYTRLFISIIIIFVLSPLAQYFTVFDVIFSFSFFSTILFSINTLSFSPKLIFICRVIASIAFVGDLFEVDQNNYFSQLLSAISSMCFGVFLLISIVAISTRIVQEKKVNSDVIKGSICIYLLLGVLWLFLYKIVFFFDNNSFNFSQTDSLSIRAQLFYFSFTTLTTLGYGDITPANSFAMMLANAEALVGQLFPAIFIAKLVSLYEHE